MSLHFENFMVNHHLNILKDAPKLDMFMSRWEGYIMSVVSCAKVIVSYDDPAKIEGKNFQEFTDFHLYNYFTMASPVFQTAL